MPFLKNTWYVAAWDFEIVAGEMFSRTVAGVPLLLWRDGDANVVVFEDRCCHRGAPLSLGCRQGDTIRCGYHGLRFDKQGTCIEIPGQADIPPNARICVYPVVEQFRWVWVWLGDPDKADRSQIPLTPWLNDPAWRYKADYMHYSVNYLAIADNLLDFSHLPYLHGDTLGGSDDFAKAPVRYEPIERGVRISRHVNDVDPPPYLAKVSDYSGRVDRWSIYDFTVPGILVMDSGSAPAGTALTEGRREGAFAFRGCQAITPETEQATHYFFAHCHNFAIDRPEVTESIHRSIIKAFHDDRHMIEAQQRNLQRASDKPMMAIRSDTGLFQFRRVVAKMLADEGEGDAENQRRH